MASRSRKSKKGFANIIVLAIFVGVVVFGFAGLPTRPGSVNSLKDALVERSHTLSVWFQNCIPSLIDAFSGGEIHCNVWELIEFEEDSTNRLPETSDPSDPGYINEIKELLAGIETEAPNYIVNYDRSEYKHWISYGSSCWNVREQVLLEQGTNVVLLDKDGTVTSNESDACSIQSGNWIDPYTGDVFTNPSSLDIDHIIPLSYANAQGGWDWSPAKKQEFANDISENLFAVSASANRSKGSKGPAEWMPPNRAFHCEYALSWVEASHKYKLPLPAADKSKLASVIDASC